MVAILGPLASVTSHALLFLAAGSARGRARFLVVPSGRGRRGAGNVICALVKLRRRFVDLLQDSFFFRPRDALASKLATNVVGGM